MHKFRSPKLIQIFLGQRGAAAPCKPRHSSRGRSGRAALNHVLHSADIKGRIPKLNAVSKTLEGLLALYNVTVGPIAAVYPQERYRKKKW